MTKAESNIVRQSRINKPLKVFVCAGHCVPISVCGSGDLFQPPRPTTGEADLAHHQEDSCSLILQGLWSFPV
jgi:hypothetical protein